MGVEQIAALILALAETTAALRDLRAEIAVIRGEVERLREASPPLLVSQAEAARRTGVSLSTIRRGVKDGSIPSRRVGRRRVLVDLAALRPKTEAEVIALARDAREHAVDGHG